MATLIAHTEDRVVFGTTREERARGLLIALQGLFFVTIPIIGLIHGVPRRAAMELLLALILLVVGLAEVGYGLWMLLKTEWLVLDLPSGTYAGRRGILFWGESLSGPIDDFDHVRLTSRFVRGRRGGTAYRRWAVDWVWRDESRRPFRVAGWGRLRSFRVAWQPGEGDRLDGLTAVRATANAAGLSLVVPNS